MTFHVFVCSKNQNLFGVTEDDPKGTKLPSGACAGGIWKTFQQIDKSRVKLSPEELKSIKDQGYCLRQSAITVTETVVSGK